METKNDRMMVFKGNGKLVVVQETQDGSCMTVYEERSKTGMPTGFDDRVNEMIALGYEPVEKPKVELDITASIESRRIDFKVVRGKGEFMQTVQFHQGRNGLIVELMGASGVVVWKSAAGWDEKPIFDNRKED